MDKETLDFMNFLKELDVIRPLYKLIVLIYDGYNKSDILKDILGGNYIVLIKDGVMKGLIDYERGKPPVLTDKGVMIGRIVRECIQKIWEREREGEKDLTP